MKTKVLLGVGIVSLALLVGVGTSVFAKTEVTVTKTSSKYIATSAFTGTHHYYAYAMETDTGYNLTYFVTQMNPHTTVEYGSGAIANSDISIGETTASLDVDTTSIATVGTGGRITLTWTGDEMTAMEMDGKSIFQMGDRKTITHTGMSQAGAVVSGTFLGSTYNGTGSITSNKGKVIMQLKNQ